MTEGKSYCLRKQFTCVFMEALLLVHTLRETLVQEKILWCIRGSYYFHVYSTSVSGSRNNSLVCSWKLLLPCICYECHWLLKQFTGVFVEAVFSMYIIRVSLAQEIIYWCVRGSCFFHVYNTSVTGSGNNSLMCS
jgi:hypothetical protein